MCDYLEELKMMKVWVLWKWIDVKGKPSKKPIASSGGPTGTNNEWSDTWVTYDEILTAKEAVTNAAGIGFVIPKDYFFLDIDDKPLEDPFVKTLIERFDSYTELSVSKSGVHIYGKCDFNQIPTCIGDDSKEKLDKAYYTKNPNNHIELYIGGLTNRFAVFTGNSVNDCPLRECTGAILTTLDLDMRRSKNKVRYSKSRDGSRDKFDIINALRKQKNGDKFSKLFDDGDYSDYRSRSEADMALCALIAFRTGPVPEAIDELFRKSALYRQKWERDDYREHTINTAREFREDLANYLGTTFQEMSTKRNGYNYYKDYTLVEEVKSEYAAEYGFDGNYHSPDKEGSSFGSPSVVVQGELPFS